MSFLRRLFGSQNQTDLLIAQAHGMAAVDSLSAKLSADVARLHHEIDVLKAQITQLVERQAQIAEGQTQLTTKIESVDINALKTDMPDLLNVAATVPALSRRLRQVESALNGQRMDAVQRIKDGVRGI